MQRKSGSPGGKKPARRSSGTGRGSKTSSSSRPVFRSKPIGLEQMEARFRAVFENSRDAIGVSKAGVHVFANPAYYELFKIPLDKAIEGTPILDLIAPGSRAQIIEFVARRAKGDPPPGRYDTRGLRTDGSEFDMEVNVSEYQENGERHTLAILRDITARKRAEEEIAERGVMLQQIMDTASVAIFLMDKSGRIVNANRRMAEMFQCSLEELTGREYIQYIHPAEREAALQKISSLLVSEIEVVDLERRFCRKDGTEFWGHVASRRFHDIHGVKMGLIVVITDIDKRKRAEQDLVESERKYRLLYNETPILLHSIDRTGVLVEVNDYWLKTLGYERSEVIGRKVTDFFTEESRKYAQGVIQPAFFRTGLVKDIAYQFVKKNGELVDVFLSATADRDAAGKVVRSFAVIEDITERKRAEESLRESEARFKAITMTASDAILLINDRGAIVYWNPAAGRMFGYSAEEALGKDLHLLLSPQNLHSDYEQGFARFIFTGKGPVINKPIELIAVRKDGNAFPIEVSVSAMNIAGRWHALGIIRDITERKRLDQEQLKTQKLESLGTLAGGIAHDFNNLLQGIFGYISMAKMTIDQKQKSLAMLGQAEKALHQSVSLTTQLLTFSKGGLPVKKRVVVRPLIENSAKFALSGSSADFRLDIDENIWMIDADEGQIGQVVHNIVLNADQAMPLGGTVSIEARNMTIPGNSHPGMLPEGDYVKITISDTGVGISEQYLPRIFDPYFTTKEKGSGLGLATSYSIIRNHGGMIDVVSEVDRGTTFTVYLRAADQGRNSEPGQGAPPVKAGRKGKILIMDDEELIRNVVGEMILSAGHEVEFAENGESALEKFISARESGAPFDIVLLDLTVRRGMGGKETIRRILAVDPDVKAIVSSGYSDDAAVSNFRSYGFRACLTKPYEAEALHRVLDELLD